MNEWKWYSMTGAGSTGPPPKTFPKIKLHDPRTHPRISTSTTSSIQGEHVLIGEQIRTQVGGVI